ncbi:MAG TPA: glycine cleavage system aminomethyltransferase GcvT [Bdellovibrionota bacterium]|jgi:aminomethyltransferase|nr:glycine cleavage system aminomethyltransferase GcvT [Bdellovibrionota bacterium]
MLKRTALFDEHVRLGGRMVDFGGWELPVQYTGIIDEHLACRGAAGLFDVSHMGEFHVEGPSAAAFLDFAVTNHVSKTAVGQAQYNVLCHPSGGIVDDLVIYRRADDRFLVVVNASNTDKDFKHFQGLLNDNRSRFSGLKLENHSAEYTQIAVQGPKAEAILQKLTETRLSDIKTYRFAEGKVCGSITAILARTGYTGEDGFEVYCPWKDGPTVWKALIEAGTPMGLKPCGLGARDTLRTEMKYPLYGHELADETNPLEAGLGWVVKFDKGDFVGRGPLEKIKAAGPARKLVGLEVLDRGIPRQGYRVLTADGREALGVLTSGTQSPSLKKAIGIAYVRADHAAAGTDVSVEIRGTPVKAKIVPTPFVNQKK